MYASVCGQVILYSALQNGQQVLEQYSEKGWELILSMWNSEQRATIREIINQKINLTVEFGRQLSKTAVKYTNPTFLYVRLTELVGPECKYFEFET